MGLVEDADEIKKDNRENAIFYPTHKSHVGDFTFYSKKYRCFKDDKIKI